MEDGTFKLFAATLFSHDHTFSYHYWNFDLFQQTRSDWTLILLGKEVGHNCICVQGRTSLLLKIIAYTYYSFTGPKEIRFCIESAVSRTRWSGTCEDRTYLGTSSATVLSWNFCHSLRSSSSKLSSKRFDICWFRLRLRINCQSAPLGRTNYDEWYFEARARLRELQQ